jgi:hypothetical protein
MNDEMRQKMLSPLHDDAVLRMAEGDADANTKAVVATTEWLAAQSATTLTLLLAGIGGALAFAAKAVTGPPGLVEAGAAAVCAYLVLLAAVLVWRCLMVGPVPAPRGDPEGWLYWPGADLMELRREGLVNIQLDLDAARARNGATARALNGVRLAALGTPLVFVLAAWLAG